MAVIGTSQVIANLGIRNAAFAKGVEQGLMVCGLLLQVESQKMVPVEFEPLKASAYTRPVGKGYATEVYVGYASAYAPFVHELTEMKLKGVDRKKWYSSRFPNAPNSHIGKFWDPQGQASAKFLEKPFNSLRPQFLGIIKLAAGIP